MEKLKIFLIMLMPLVFIVCLVTGGSERCIESGMVCTDNSGIPIVAAWIIVSLALIFIAIYGVITAIHNRHLPGVNIPMSILFCSPLVLGGAILLIIASGFVYKTVATIDFTGNSLQFEEYFLSGKTQTWAYSFDKIDVIKLDYYDDGEEVLVVSMTIVLSDGREIDSPVTSSLLARRLSECTGARLIEEGRISFDE